MVINHSLYLKKKDGESNLREEKLNYLTEAGSTLSSINSSLKYSCQHSGHILLFMHQLCNFVLFRIFIYFLFFRLVSVYDIVGMSECWQENSQWQRKITTVSLMETMVILKLFLYNFLCWCSVGPKVCDYLRKWIQSQPVCTKAL